MRSKGSLLFCNECDNKVLVDTYGFLNAQTVNDVAFNDMIEWRRWQNEYLRKEIDSEDFKMEFFGSLTVKDGYGKVLTVYPESTLTITKNEIKYAYPGGNTILLFHCITDAVSDYSLRFEINQERNSYQFTPLNGQTVIKITDAIKCIKGILQ